MYATNATASHVMASSARDVITFRERVAIGATGAASQGAAIGKSPGYDTAFTCTRASAGTYSLVFPIGKRAWINVALLSAASTVVTWVLTALDAAAGTATLVTLAGTNAAAATDPASGDALLITIDVER